MISHLHKTIFVHVPKVAGQSIEHMFLQELGLDWDQRASLLLRKKLMNEEGPERLAHLTAKEYTSLGYIEPQKFNTYFKFSFVRNPYKRVLSFYNFLGYSRVISLKTFIEKVIPKKIEERDFFFLSQYEYLYDDNGTLLVDYVGKLESIKTDIKSVILRTGLKNASLPHVNKSKGEWKRAIKILIMNPALFTKLSFGNYKKSFEAQFTEEMKSKVANLYPLDFKVFNYDL